MADLRTSISPPAGANRRLRVLLVDDTPQVLRDLSLLLELTGDLDIVGKAADGIAAVRLAAELAPDAVIMDLEMPGMDGCEATRRIKNALPSVRVIILSIHAGSEERRCALAAGADCFVVKGENYELLVNAIRVKGGPADSLNHRKGKQA